MTTTAAATVGEMETVVDADEAAEMRTGTACDRAVGHRLMNVRVGRPPREGNSVAATVFRDEEYEVFKFRDAVWMWPIGVEAGGFIRP